ncbi:zinc-dependent peptidase [Aureibaculum sp. A20]|uniref:Zinc-dependent peptidase n=1 Tax=Aureibaculum flavum TaxID=2795986 RepID=A0ABS0WWU0_9FLAO|nr:zinc-dependent peptidase [Aureibaculum flavum]MBJ2176460.1 zinc-dependent peptidase [Aureibaculum flavum]
MNYILLIIVFCTTGYYLYYQNQTKQSKWRLPKESFPADWRVIIIKNISYYNSLSTEEQNRFEYKIHEFVLNYEIIGVKTSITITDKLLVASSAIIPIFGFDNWQYSNLHQILIYPTMFNEKFETEGSDRKILGMVGNGYMEGTMILSQEALLHGFKNESDKKNTAIHEFVHLIDKTGGTIDGIPSVLMQKQYTIPWIDMMNQKLEEIYNDDSDINPYGGTNKAEFFSVASEYFFERPKLLKKKHPELYKSLERIFNQDMSSRNLSRKIVKIERNSPCPCNSGKKYKKCCGAN